MIGIYKIENKINNKVYIGQSRNIIKRFEEHRRDLCKGKHANYHLQNAWNKYGEDNFLFEIIEETTAEKLNERETFWKLANDPNTYNLGNTGCVGTESEESRIRCSITIRNKLSKLSTEERKAKFGNPGKSNPNYGKTTPDNVKEKIRNKLLGHPSYERTDEILSKQRYAQTTMRKIAMFDLEGNFIRTFDSINQACRELNLDQAGISTCCMGKRSRVKQYVFRYVEDCINII